MDDRAVTEPDTLFPPQTSTEKVQRAIERFLGDPPPDPMISAAVMAMGMAWPGMRARLQAMDPAELDVILLAGAKWCFSLRSDDAHVPEDLDELFLGTDDEDPA